MRKLSLLKGQLASGWAWRSVALIFAVAALSALSFLEMRGSESRAIETMPQANATANARPLEANASAPIPVKSSTGFDFAEPLFEAVGDTDSIPLGVVTALAQDASGMHWIGTEGGLVRYDGYRFRKYIHDDRDSGTLPGNFVRSLWRAPDNRLWIGTSSSGLAVYDPSLERFSSFSHDPKRSTSLNSSGTVWALAGNATGDVWIGTDNGLDFLPAGSTDFQHYQHVPGDGLSLASNQVRSLLVDRHGILWVGTADGLQRLRPDGKGFERVVSSTGGADAFAGQSILTMLEAKDGKLWFGTARLGAAWLDPSSLKLQFVNSELIRGDQLIHTRVHAIAQALDGQIWLGSFGDGISVVAPDDGTVLHHWRHDISIGNSLASDNISALMVDRSGLLLVGTMGSGLQRHNPRNPAFHLLRHSPTRPSGLSQANVFSVLELHNGQLLVGTSGNGIDIFDRKRGRVGGYRAAPGRQGELSDGFIRSMAQTADGTLWVGTQGTGVQRLTVGAKAWQTFSIASGVPNPAVRKVFVDRKGELWAGTAKGLAHWDRKRALFESLMGTDGQPMQGYVTALIDDSKGRLWVATLTGLWVLEPGAKTLRRIYHDKLRSTSLSSDSVRGLLEDHIGQIWVDTGEGLNRLISLDDKEAQFENISARLGRPGLYLGGNLLEDKLGRIWTGWFVLDPKIMKLYSLSKADGMDIGTAWMGSFGKTKDGLFLFGGTQGLAVVEPEKFQAWEFQPAVVATELKINGQTTSINTLTPRLNLRPEQRNFSLEFSSLDFSAPNKNIYRYRLDGYDKGWNNTAVENRVAAYGNLAPGDYTLRVVGSNRTGEWSSHELAIAIRVFPSWYQTWWFRFVGVLAFAASIGALFQGRTRYLRERQSVLEAQVKDRTMALESKQQELETANQDLQLSNSNLHQTQTKLVEQEKLAALGSLVAGVAHELNTPIGNSLMAASTLEYMTDTVLLEAQEGKMRKSSLDTYWRNAKLSCELLTRNLSSAANLINSFKQIAVDQASEQRRVFNLENLVNEVIVTSQSQLHGANHSLLIAIPAEIELDSYPGSFDQVIFYLLTNAITHAFDKTTGGTITITASQIDDSRIRFTFGDDGCGIDEQNLGHIFEPFFTTRMGQGSCGLGLSICFNIVTGVLGGSIEVQSELGKGTSFEMIIPMCAPVKPADADIKLENME